MNRMALGQAYHSLRTYGHTSKSGELGKTVDKLNQFLLDALAGNASGQFHHMEGALDVDC
jgi:hypothetical protein